MICVNCWQPIWLNIILEQKYDKEENLLISIFGYKNKLLAVVIIKRHGNTI
jgi:hypothetical protein